MTVDPISVSELGFQNDLPTFLDAYLGNQNNLESEINIKLRKAI